MNHLMTNDVKMTSLEIAEVTGKRHQHILRDIRKEVDDLGTEIGQSIFGRTSYKDKSNRESVCYEFGKEGAMQLALKYDAKTRYNVIQHINKLERNHALISEIMNNPEILSRIAEKVALLEVSNNQNYEKLETIDRKIEGEYVTPQDIDAIKYAIKVKAEKFMEQLGQQLTIESFITDQSNIYEQAQASKVLKQQQRHETGKLKSKILVYVKKALNMKGNAPNNHIKRKNVDVAIQIIKDTRVSDLNV